MINIDATNLFHRSYFKLIKKHPEIDLLFKNAIQALAAELRPLHLKIHKLSGDLNGSWAFSLDSDVRVVFRYQKEGILLVGIGKHDDIY